MQVIESTSPNPVTPKVRRKAAAAKEGKPAKDKPKAKAPKEEISAEEKSARQTRAIEQVLLNFPVGYDDYRRTIPRGRAKEYLGVQGCFILKVRFAPKRVRGAQPRFIVEVTDGVLDMEISGFGVPQASPLGRLYPGQIVKVSAVPKEFGSTLTLTAAEIIPKFAEGRLMARYQTRKSVMSAERIREFVEDAISNEQALAKVVAEIRAHFNGASDAEIGKALGRPSFTISGLLHALHAPQDESEAEAAQAVAKRLAAQALIWQARAGARRIVSLKSVFLVDPNFLTALVGCLPFPATASQVKVIQQICDGLRAPYPMNMLLSGDVGTGKTAAYSIPAVAAYMMGAKVGVMIPNYVLAKNIETELKEWFPDIKTVFVGGDAKPPKPEDLAGNPIIIGTTAILHQMPKLDWKPDFFITDEQQKTSVEQRGRLLLPHTNVLEATATCMPRTKALVEHGAIDVAILNEFPVKKTIYTKIVQQSGRKEMFAHLKRTVDSGGQIAVIYPVVEGKDKAGEKKSVEAAGRMWENLFPGKVGVLHGQMEDADKLRVLGAMKAGELKVLVASTVIEVGVTIPALRDIMIVHAERYGVSTLHQMRGRVARHGGEGYCFLYLPEPVSEDAMARMKLLEKHSDGFVLAEKDMQMRGFGDLSSVGESQHGATKAIFFGLELMPEDVDREMNRDQQRAASAPASLPSPSAGMPPSESGVTGQLFAQA